MIAKIIISTNPETRGEVIKKILSDYKLSPNHPDLLYLPYDSKLGIEQAKKIKDHFSLKPYSAKGSAVVLENGGELTIEAQNALLKTIEELPEDSLFIMGSSSESKLLPTILSRCEVIHLKNLKNPTSQATPTSEVGYAEVGYAEVEKLLNSSTEQRFEYIEKLKDKEEFLQSLVKYFHQNLASHIESGNVEFLKKLLSAEEWAEHNVNIRAILEYLMLNMPSKPS